MTDDPGVFNQYITIIALVLYVLYVIRAWWLHFKYYITYDRTNVMFETVLAAVTAVVLWAVAQGLWTSLVQKQPPNATNCTTDERY